MSGVKRVCLHTKCPLLLPEFEQNYTISGGTRWRSRLRHCATNRKALGLIPDVVIEVLH